MAEAEEVPEPLKYQTLALKVSIHCEGCKREVKRVLQHMEGVYKISIDPQQHKVVVTGNVAAETLIKKLAKTGKHAELWPEKKPNENTRGGGSGKKNKSKNKNEGKPNEPLEKSENNQTSSGDGSSDKVSDKPNSEAPKKNDGEESTPVPRKQNGTDKAAANAGGGKNKGKKGQKEEYNSSSSSGGSGSQAVAEVEVASQEASKKAAGGGLVTPQALNVPMCNTSQLPYHLVSYSSMQPSMSYGGAYYPTPMPQSSYIYSAALPGSYYFFSEENADACSIM